MNRASTLLAVIALMIPMLTTSIMAAPNETENVRSVVARFVTAWNHHDMDAFGKLFALDADFVNVAGEHWVGRKEIQLKHAYAHGAVPVNSDPDDNPRYYGIFKHSTISFGHIDVRFLREDVALAHTSCELVGDARTQNVRRCVLTFVLTQENGEWLIAAAHNTEINRTVK